MHTRSHQDTDVLWNVFKLHITKEAFMDFVEIIFELQVVKF